MKICNPHITVFELWLCVLPQYKAQVLAVYSRETRNDSDETRRVSREGGNLHLSGTVRMKSRPIETGPENHRSVIILAFFSAGIKYTK